ncbi:MAG: 2-oxoglutarate ferredoxin oxidoreductase subunit gamma [Candidatus Cloacimonetes bacterium 4572_65]|nr:MAG: 2-oxoglutarate ferredoxin oxidoreductase subunit gamma [Candidatus Cloacimonetes bacterium 4572_65]
MATKLFKKDVRLSGSGGQGLILAGIILARAAVHDELNVTQTQSYGPESRGGYSKADVVISNQDINFPEATNLDVLLSLTQEACDKYVFDLKNDGILIADSSTVKNISVINDNTYEVSFADISEKEFGSALFTNILSLAFSVKISKIVTEKALELAIKESVKPAFVEKNVKAMKLGFKLAKEYK